MESKKEIVRDYHTVNIIIGEVGAAILTGRSVSDCPQVARFLKDNEFSSEIVSNLTSSEFNRRMYDAAMVCDKHKQTERILACIERLEREKRNRFRSRSTAIAAAAAVCIILTTAYFVWKERAVHDRTEHQISLILSDGQTIALDGAFGHRYLIDDPDIAVRNDDESLIVESRTAAPEDAAPPQSLYTLKVDRCCRYDIILGDGTRIWLNSESYLKFPPVFAKDERRVFVEGEAYFEVAADTARSFIVETAGQTIYALGTAFNVYSYPNEPVIYTALIEGRALVSSPIGDILLTPDHICEFDKDNLEYHVKAVKAGAYSGWIGGDMFILDHNTLDQALMKISRWYDVDFIFDPERARSIVYRGNLPKFREISEILESIEMTSPIKFVKEDDRYKIMIM